MSRKEKLITGEIYHVYTRSIADFRIFNNDYDFLRMRDELRYYQPERMPLRFCQFIELENVKENGFGDHFLLASRGKERRVQIIAYCLMPTHLHLILKQIKDNGISHFMGNVLNSHSRYFNTKYKRKGPLWEGKFQNILVENDEQLFHLTVYIHLNPVTSYLVDIPEKWPYSSYREYISKIDENSRICEHSGILEIDPTKYREIVEDRIFYQRELAGIKKHLVAELSDNYTSRFTPRRCKTGSGGVRVKII